ncbi:patatin-like phospholipase family protein [Luteimonas deserti]|uniref:Patatin-like phospholipase family protein n=1 Tax=Luteimonas deserti TaxID=2752306 RepID=A0A7Z0TUP6_9GAMM|nr:patatin-like phospholipase family protein [Luteimonas deserti]NYZ61384.1 patatin-like phospholipase family protein [Luteimonas deserti]
MPPPTRSTASADRAVAPTARPRWRVAALSALVVLFAGCGRDTVRPEPVAAPAPATVAPTPTPRPPPVRIGLALGGGAAKGFAHIGVIKMLEANGIKADVVAGTSAGSVVGALYASGMDPFRMQERAVALDESSIRDVRLFSGGLVQGVALQNYVNQEVGNRTIDRMPIPFAAVATRLDTGDRTVFVRGNTGQAVRASSSVPGVFEPVRIGERSYVDGGVVSPVPVDAARQLGADLVIAVDISSKASGATPGSMLGIVNQSIAIMGQTLGRQELARADVVIRPQVNDIGPASFEQRNAAILQGERAALAALPQIRAKLAEIERARSAARVPARPATPVEPAPVDIDCGDSWVRRLNPFAKDRAC